MQRVTDQLYIGDIHDAGDQTAIERSDVTAVLKLTHTEPANPYPDSVSVRRHPLIDGPQNDPDDLRGAVRALIELLDAPETVLVHCAAGVSRSGIVAALAIAERDGITITDAVARVQAERPAVDPHPALLDQARTLRDTDTL